MKKTDSRTKKNIAFIRRRGVMLLALLLCMLFSLSAAAQSTARIPTSGVDLSKTGSVLVTLTDADGNSIPGGTLRLYQVARIAEADGAQSYALTEAFDSWSGTEDDLLSDRDCAENLAAFADARQTAWDAQAENKNGPVSFTDLAPGVYLITQSEAADGYEGMLPFLAFLPQLTDGVLRYDIEASPKPVHLLPPGAVEIAAEKLVNVISGTAPKNVVFSFILTPESPEAPMPKNPDAVYNNETGAMTVSRTGPGVVHFGTLPLTLADVGAEFEYTIREVRGSAAHFTYDTTVYTLCIEVRSDDGKSVYAAAGLYKNGSLVETAAFINQYDGGSTPEIPRTGQLWWPVLVLLPAGCALVLTGIACRRKRDDDEDEFAEDRV